MRSLCYRWKRTVEIVADFPYQKNISWAIRKLFWAARAICLKHFSKSRMSKTTYNCSTFISYFWMIKMLHLKGRKKNSVNLQPTFLCTSAPALNRDLCHLIMTDFYPVYFSPSASCPCVIACLTLEVGHPSYWTHLGHYFQCSFMYTIHTINIAVISCS